MIKATSLRPWFILALLASFGGCGVADGREGASDNLVRSRRKDGWPAESAWRLRTITHIGKGGDSTAFGHVVDLAIDPLGRVWVADGMEQQIKLFHPDGRLVRTIGRKGAGPGEFAAIAGFDWAADGTLWVVDGGNARFTVFDTAGNLLQTRPRPATLTITPWPGAFDRAGRLTDVAGTFGPSGEKVTFLVRSSMEGSTVDTLRLPVVPQEIFGEITSGTEASRSVKRAPVPFTGQLIWAVDPEGFAWVGMTDEYRLERRRFDGTVERVIELENAAPRVTAADRDQILRNYRWFEEQGGKLDASRIPGTHPDLVNLFFDDAGHLWILPAYRFQQKPAIDVFDLQGKYLGQVQTPVSIGSHPAPTIRNGLMAAVAIDPDGVSSVVLMRIEKPAR